MLKINDLVEGEIYVTNYPGQGDYIFKSNGDNKDVTYLQVDRNSFSDYGDMSPENGFKSYKLPTDEQKHWFLECKKTNKFISYEEAMKTFKPNFEVGKWYKCLWHKKYVIYIKPTSIHKTAINCDGDNSIWCHHNNIIYNSGSYMPTALTIVNLVEDLSEIQQWLPEGHPDKVSNSLIGRYLKALVNKPVSIGLAKKGDYFIILDDFTDCKSVKDNVTWSYKNRSEEINPEIWELMPVGFSPNQIDSIPEYVECVNAWHKDWTTGKIYKTEETQKYFPTKLTVRCDKDVATHVENWDVRKGVDCGFKISTKEAFEAQNKPIIEEWSKGIKPSDEIEVGDEVECNHGKGIVLAISEIGNYLVNGKTKSGHTGGGGKLKKGKISDKYDSWYYNLSELKLIKKANNTTTLTQTKKDDVLSPKVENKVTVQIIERKIKNPILNISVQEENQSIFVPLIQKETKKINNITIKNFSLTI